MEIVIDRLGPLGSSPLLFLGASPDGVRPALLLFAPPSSLGHATVATMMKARLRRWVPLQRLPSYRLRYVLVPAVLWFVVGVLLLGRRHLAGLVPLTRQRLFGPPVNRMAPATALPKLASRISCRGPRGRVLSDSPDDELRYGDVSVSYPTPFLGSQRELGIHKTWMTADGRYGPYGFGEDKDTYNRSTVDWDRVDWGKLQDDCFDRNAERFPAMAPSVQVKGQTRFSWRNQTAMKTPTPAWDAFNGTRRAALVIRSYSNFDYKPEDMWHLRSLIAETALHSGGEYAVFLLVHVQDRESNVLRSQANYDDALRAASIPPELQSIVVLWDDHLLESWYEAIEEHRTMWQVNQPLQLFALHYPEFDHYWQIEMDQRFMGHAGEYLDAVSAFARNEPRKQALERATYAFNEDLHGTYKGLTAQVDAANNGTSRAWGPVGIPDIRPIGPEPPVPRPEDDDFLWGIGEDADVVVTSMCADVMHTEWTFRDYITGFFRGQATPRWFCPPAVMRASRALLLAVHQGQHDQGLSIPSEAVLPTWALWHGLKLSYPPQPAYMRPHEPELEDFKDETTRDEAAFRNKTKTPWFGTTPAQSTDGLSHGNPQSFADRGMTWWWTASWPRRIVDIWLAGDTEAERMPALLAVVDGRVYVPNLAMHPVKT
ncbi:hypothetical protein TOPH_02902 [Tolypocladium ophioglossoides CBS 100239]|uniref:Uncharacterized protein n=1 Tax=Tolypocladium ophioglossoides (strain CBS 100239) TaxID=1163406 RepID=A0A0L0NDI5_TOLOC|nr:hypothetical protein TOPH_02902 [Tolypocladium ophioglossoides CBS 100239]